MSTRHLRKARELGEGLDVARSLCGKRGDLVAHASEVNCGLCRRKLRSDTRIDIKRLLLTHAEEVLTHEPDALPYRSRASMLSEGDRLAIARIVDGAEDTWSEFPSVKSAAKALAAYIDEGASLTSSSSPSRFGAISQTRTGLVSNVERQVDRVVGVRVALDRAYRDGMRFGPTHVPPDVCFEVYLLRRVGVPYFTSKRRECVQRRELLVSRIVEIVAATAGLDLTAHQVGVIARAGDAGISEYLDRTAKSA